MDEDFRAPGDLFRIWENSFAEDCSKPDAVWNAPRPPADVLERCKPLKGRKTPNDCAQTLYFFRRIIDQHQSQAFIKTCAALFLAGAALASLRTQSLYRYGNLYASVAGPTSILAMLCSIQSHTLIHRETLQYFREFKSGMSVNGYFFAKLVYDGLCTLLYGTMWALACYTISPPIQGPFQVYIWMYIAFAFYWSSFGSWIAVTFSSSYTVGLLIMVFAPTLEVLWSGTDNDRLGQPPIRDLQGTSAAMSAISSGRWMQQGIYCGELLALPSHILGFDATLEQLYNASVINTKDTPPTATDLENGVSSAFLGLFLCGTAFRFLTWCSFLLTKYSQGSTRRSQILFILRQSCQLVCSNNLFFQEEDHEVLHAQNDFDHTNLQAVLNGDKSAKRNTESSILPFEVDSTGTRKVTPMDEADLKVVINP